MDRTRRMSSAHREHRQSRFNDGVPNSVLNHYNNYHRRPTHRVRRNNRRLSIQLEVNYVFLILQNANLLSAVLCLVKELDTSSLEVVEHAVRCRIEELHAQVE